MEKRVVVVSHNIDVVFEVADRIGGLAHLGRVILAVVNC